MGTINKMGISKSRGTLLIPFHPPSTPLALGSSFTTFVSWLEQQTDLILKPEKSADLVI